MKSHIDYLSVKLNRVNALLFEIRNLASNSVLKIYNLSIFESHLNYCSLVWSQSCNAINQLALLQKKLSELLTFSHVTLTLALCSKKIYSEILR